MLPLNHGESCMIHHCSSMSHDCNKCSSTTPFCCGVPGAVYSKIIPKSFLSDSVSSALFSPALLHLIILTWISCLAFKDFIQSIIGLTCSFFFFKKRLFLILCCFSNQHYPMLSSPMLGFLIDDISKNILSPGLLLLS